MPLLHRLFRTENPSIAFVLNGKLCEGRRGDSLLTAILLQADKLRLSEFSAEPRAGFCQMGACQDCWVRLEDGTRLRACTTALEPGMCILTEHGS